jgi:acetyl-CoA acetyltransferase
VLTLGNDGIKQRRSKDCDVHAIRSQQTWGQAQKNGVFDLEIAPVEVKTKKGVQVRSTLEFAFVRHL